MHRKPLENEELLQTSPVKAPQSTTCLLVLHDYSISCHKWRKNLQDLFSEHNAVTFCIPNSRAEALELLKNNSFDVMTVELQIGDEFPDDGYSFVEEARKAGFTGAISFAKYPIAPIEN